MAKEVAGEIILKDVRMSYAHLFTPQEGQKRDDGTMGPDSYGVQLMFPKNTAQGKANFEACKKGSHEAKLSKWKHPDNFPHLKEDKVFLRDGDKEDLKKNPEYKGMWLVSTRNTEQPQLIDCTKDDKGEWNLLTKTNGGPRKLYSGASCNAIVRAWAQDNEPQKGGKRVNASIECVQFRRHGDPLSGRAPVNANDKFTDDDVEQEEGIGGPDEDEDDGAGLV